jgi:hypothetical protein
VHTEVLWGLAERDKEDERQQGRREIQKRDSFLQLRTTTIHKINIVVKQFVYLSCMIPPYRVVSIKSGEFRRNY